MRNALIQLHVPCLRVRLDLLRVLLGLRDHGFLDDYGRGEVFEELVQLQEGALDGLDVVVAGADGAEDGGGRGAAVSFELGRGMSVAVLFV